MCFHNNCVPNTVTAAWISPREVSLNTLNTYNVPTGVKREWLGWVLQSTWGQMCWNLRQKHTNRQNRGRRCDLFSNKCFCKTTDKFELSISSCSSYVWWGWILFFFVTTLYLMLWLNKKHVGRVRRVPRFWGLMPLHVSNKKKKSKS